MSHGLVDELVVDGSLDEGALDGDAGLAAVEEGAGDEALDGLVDRCAFEDDQRVLAAELQRVGHETLAGGDGDPAAGGAAAGEGDVVDVADELAAGRSVAVHQLGERLGQTGLAQQADAISADSGVNSDGLTTTALPARSAGIASPTLRMKG